MALANGIQNARHSPQQITWTDSDGLPQDLTNATLTGRILQNGTSRAIDGTLTTVTATSGIFNWYYGANDVGTPGDCNVQFIATYSTDSKNDKTFVTHWHVDQAL